MPMIYVFNYLIGGPNYFVSFCRCINDDVMVIQQGRRSTVLVVMPTPPHASSTLESRSSVLAIDMADNTSTQASTSREVQVKFLQEQCQVKECYPSCPSFPPIVEQDN